MQKYEMQKNLPGFTLLQNLYFANYYSGLNLIGTIIQAETGFPFILLGIQRGILFTILTASLSRGVH
jgi:hypothetical protein